MRRTSLRSVFPVALVAAFVGGVLIDGWFRTYGPPKPVVAGSDLDFRATPKTPIQPRDNRDLTPAAAAAAPAAMSAPPTANAPASERAVTAPAPVATSGDIPHGRLRVPVDGADVDAFKGGFNERRGGERPHEAVDMLAPRNTPVHAVEGGTIAKLFTSKAGGLTIYQFDPSGRLCYYYAHLERYADGLKDGQVVSQGEVIGYVGTSGNAPPNTPHLHFAVFELNADKHWWQGRPLDPYRVFKDRG
jgi:murein DD-endopeptidase MepM/ murein hydrolase activator NlpD